MTRYLFLLFFTGSISCTNSPSAGLQPIDKDSQSIYIEANSGIGLKEVRLGDSNYYLLLPDNFEISEAQGKEGQLGYNIIPIDTSSTMFGFIEIQHGNPIGDSIPLAKGSELFANSRLLNKTVRWTIQKSETGYYEAFTTEKGDLNAHVASMRKTEVDSMISIIATLKQK